MNIATKWPLKGPINNINIPGYNTEHTHTKSDKGGALLYISK